MGECEKFFLLALYVFARGWEWETTRLRRVCRDEEQPRVKALRQWAFVELKKTCLWVFVALWVRENNSA